MKSIVNAQLRRLSTVNKSYPKTYEKILIASRGEAARRVIKTAKKMGIKTVALFSDADQTLPYVKEADQAFRVGPAAAKDSYLNQNAILEIVKSTGAQAVHPGYGFLALNTQFQKVLLDNKVKLIAPPSKAIQSFSDKLEAKKMAREAKVSIIPGSLDEIKSSEEVVKAARQIGYPVEIKATQYGKAVRIANNDDEAIAAY